MHKLKDVDGRDKPGHDDAPPIQKARRCGRAFRRGGYLRRRLRVFNDKPTA
jgi:hypothetical protein